MRVSHALCIGALASCDALSGLSDFSIGPGAGGKGGAGTTTGEGGAAGAGSPGSGGMGGSGGAPPPACVVDVAVLYRQSCALLGDGTVWCFGSNSYGQLGTGTFDSSPVPVLAAISDVVDIEMGRGHVLALDASGQVYNWGENDWGQLGTDPGTMPNSPTPTRVMGLEGVTHISAGSVHSCAVHGGAVSCWGGNGHGQLGLPEGTPLWSTTPYTVFATDTGEVHAGSVHTCLTRASNNLIFCWGGNQLGQVGAPDTQSEPPGSYTGSLTAAMMAARATHNCVVLANGDVFCWGRNAFGELGIGAGPSTPTPTRVPGLPSVHALYSGGRRNCARVASGELWCWGEASFDDPIGSPNAPIDPRLPELVPELAGATGISMGAYHQCAIFADGRLYCMGNNENGQLGDGTTASSTTWVEAQLPCN